MAGTKRARVRNLLVRGGRAARARLPGGPTAPVGSQRVVFQGLGEGDFEPGTTVLQAAAALDLDLDHFCGGNCSCGTCRVELIGPGAGLSPMRPSESIVLGHEAVEAGDRLACQAFITGPVSVRIPTFFMRGA